MQKGEIIQEICGHLLNGNKAVCSEIAKEKYPFTNYLTDKRKAAFDKMHIWHGFDACTLQMDIFVRLPQFC